MPLDCITSIAASFTASALDALAPEIAGDLIAARDRLNQFRQFMAKREPAVNDELLHALNESFWLALLHVVAHEGEDAGAPVTIPDWLIATSGTLTKVWNSVRQSIPSGPPPTAYPTLTDQGTAEIARALYQRIFEKLREARQAGANAPNHMDQAYQQAETFFHRSQSPVELAQLLTAEALAQLRALNPEWPPTGAMEDYLRRNWFTLFRSALQTAMKTDPDAREILKLNLLSEIHQTTQHLAATVASQQEKLTQDIARHRVQIRDELWRLKVIMVPPKEHAEMDWDEALDRIAVDLPKHATALRDILGQHGGALPRDVTESLQKAFYEAQDGSCQLSLEDLELHGNASAAAAEMYKWLEEAIDRLNTSLVDLGVPR